MQHTSMRHYSTSSVSANNRVSYWNNTCNGVFDSINIDSQADVFDAKLAVRQIGDFDLSQVETTPTTVYHRRRESGFAEPPAMIKIHLQEQGRSINRQGEREAALANGEFTLCDTTRPYFVNHHSAINRMLVLRIPTHRVASHLGDPEQFVGARLGTGPGAAMFAAFMRTLWETPDESEDETWGKTISDVVLGLLVLACKDRSIRQDEDLGEAINPEWQRKLRSFIDENLHDPSLRSSSIASAFGISPRYLQMIFASMGNTASAYIRELRLKRAADALLSNTRVRGIADVAYDVGFQDLSYFNKSFRNHFGVAPKQYRAGMRSA